MRVALIFNSFCFVRGSFWASGEALHGAPLAESANPPKSSKPRVFPRFGVKFAQKRVFFHVFGFKMLQNHAFFYVLALELLKNTRFSTFWRQICSKTRVFPRFWLQNASKPRIFLRFGFRIAQKHAFFYVLASEFVKNMRVSTYLASKRCVFPRFGFRIAQKRVFFNVFAFKVAQSHVFSQVLASTLFKKRALHNFSLQISTAVFRRFWFEEVQKNTFFHVFYFKILQCKVYFFTDRRLCTQVLRARKLLHTDDLHT